MAASTCRLTMLTTCKLFDRLLISGRSVSRLYTTHNHGLQHTLSKGPVSTASNLLSECKHLCRVKSSPLVTSHRFVNWYTDKRVSKNLGAVGIAKVDPDVTVITDTSEGQELAEMVNASVEQKDHGRLFAVVSIAGGQRRVTVEDVLVIEADFPPTVGDRIRLEKVLMVGGKDFSLLGQPLLSRDQIQVEATVIEKTLSHNRICSTYKKRKRFRKLKLFRTPQTMILINSIRLNPVPKLTD